MGSIEIVHKSLPEQSTYFQMLYRNDPMARWRARRCAPIDICIYITCFSCIQTSLKQNNRRHQWSKGGQSAPPGICIPDCPSYAIYEMNLKGIIEVRDSRARYLIPQPHGPGVWSDGRVAGALPSAASENSGQHYGKGNYLTFSR